MKPIKNTFSVRQNQHDIITSIFFIDTHKCRIVTRQFDTPLCNHLEIQIDDEVIIIDPSLKINDVTLSKTILVQDDTIDNYKQLIPKIIIQTSERHSTTDEKICLQEMNPEYEYRFFTDSQRREFLKSTFLPKVVDAYDMLVPGAFKADLFRYGYLFIHGGCYFDDKIIPREPLRHIIHPEDDLLLCQDVDSSSSILNAIIMTVPQNFLFLKLLLTACDNVLSQQRSNDMLSLTGPKLMHTVFKPFISEKNMRFKHLLTNNDYSSYKNFLILDRNTDKLLFSKTTQEALQRFCFDTNHYRQLWIRNEVFYKNKVTINNLAIFVYPNPYVDTFQFTIDENELTIERSDCHDPWHFHLKLKILDVETSQVSHEDIGINRVFPTRMLKLPSRVFLSSQIKENDFVCHSHSTIVLILSSSDVARQYVKKENEVVILCETSQMSNKVIETFHYDYLVLFSGSDAVYHCKEKDTRTKQIYMIEYILSRIKSEYAGVKLILSDADLSHPAGIIKKGHVSQLVKNVSCLYKYPHIDLVTFCQSYKDLDIPKQYNEVIDRHQNIILDLNDIIKKSGELLEGNVFYEHHSVDFNVHSDFQNKRYNLFYHGKLAVDILEIGFNAGHSALLYLLANPYSRIHFFDLGEHQYSRSCYDYLNQKFPGRLSVVWGDSTLTIPLYESPQRFDFLHIDGGHTRFIAESDFYNCKSLAKPEALVMIDDYNGNCLHTFCNQLIKYNKFRKVNLLYENGYHILGTFT